MSKDTITVNMNVYDIPIIVEQLNKLEQLLLDAIDVDNLPAIERYEAAIASIKEEIKKEEESKNG